LKLNKVTPIRFPENSLIQESLQFSTFKDAYSISFKAYKMVKPEEVMKCFFTSMHPLVRIAFSLREVFATLIGFKKCNRHKISWELQNYTGTIGESMAFLTILDKTDTELLTGQDDRPLDFRISFLVRTYTEKTEIVIATSIQIKTWYGKVYLVIIKPFHKLIMPLVLKRIRNVFQLRH
jgi:hypothetical protein